MAGPVLTCDNKEGLPVHWECVTDVYFTAGDATLSRREHLWELRMAEVPVVVAWSYGLHPTTVHAHEWRCATRLDRRVPLRFVHPRLHSSSAADPIPIAELGRDFFIRVRLRSTLWYRDAAGRVFHSGAKHGGRRYCPWCDASYSANNFVHQHLRVRHPELPLPGAPVCDFALTTQDVARAITSYGSEALLGAEFLHG